MSRVAAISNVERTFILESLSHNLRLDRRALDQYRMIQLSFGEQYGTATVSLGRTKVYVQVSAEVAKPAEERKFDGTFTITTEISPIASPGFEVGRPTEQEVILSRILEKAIRRSRAIDTEALCIVAGQKCWSVRADVHVLDFDGNLVDASCMAIMAALQHFRRPEVSVDGEDVTIHTLAERVPVPLSILHQPVCITFSLFHDGAVILLDATLKEEQVREAEMVVTTNDFEVCQIAKLGGKAVDADVIARCLPLALAKAREMNTLIKKRLSEDSTQRDVGGLIAELRADNER